MKTLPDYIDYDLDILSIGLNPSTISIEKGYYFANPRNRFWKALNRSKLIRKNDEFIPSKEAQEELFKKYSIGFTDVVKRSSSMGKDLRAEDYKKWAPQLKLKIDKFKPKICWFHGKVAINNYFKYSLEMKQNIIWGKQKFTIQDSIFYVTPNPSPANAAFSLDEIIRWYDKLSVLKSKI